MKGSRALITGATSGIGEATALRLADLGCDLVLTGRREPRLNELKQKLSKKVNVETIAFDIQKRDECEKAIARIRPESIRILINNAGLAKGVEGIPSAKVEDWEQMLDTNVLGLLLMTRGIVPEMVKQKKGDIINLGSVAGRWSYPGGGVYCATKAAVRAITEGLRMDLMGTGVRVTNIAPGMVDTEFSDVRMGSKEAARKVYHGMTPLSSQDIADAIVWCLERPSHVNIQEMILFPTDQAGVGYVHRQ
jgi:3-hydroxy acid dehydrogenase / malonic semialdehyde reductase